MTVNLDSLFKQFYTRGENELIHVRRILDRTNTLHNTDKTWGASQAAALIGRSVPWLRENDPDAPKNEQSVSQWSLTRINQIRNRIGKRLNRPANTKPHVVAINNIKGGVSKTTTTAHLAHAMAIAGLRVLCLDFDPQGSLTHWLGRLLPEIDLSESDVPVNALLNNPLEITSLIRSTAFTNVSLIPSSPHMQDLDLLLPNSKPSNGVPKHPAIRLKYGLDQLYFSDNFDVILIDCPPNMGSLTINALVAANCYIMPMRPATLDRAAFVALCSSFAGFFKTVLHDRVDYLRILITQHTGSSDDVYNESRIRTLYGEHVLSQVLHQSSEISKAASQLSTVYQLNKPINSRDTYKRALSTLDAVNNEIIKDLLALWGRQ